MKRVFKNNGLSISILLLFVVAFAAQAITGFKEHNDDLIENGAAAIKFSAYIFSGHFIEATFENFESEFLQMGMYLVLTTFLYQKGSAKSKDPDKTEEVDRTPDATRKNAPWPVRKGGLALAIYRHSLSLSMFLLFLLSFLGHWYGSLKEYNEQQMFKHLPTESAFEYLGEVKFWFESFQNWQSEFLSIFAIVVLSIFLREQGSSQSKPVDAPDFETGS